MLVKSLIAACLLTCLLATSEWDQWKAEFGKKYSPEEESIRRQTWQNTKAKIEQHNARYEQSLVSYAMKLTQFADMTEDEILQAYTMQATVDSPNVDQTTIELSSPDNEPPKSINWVEKGYVTSVKQQGKHCKAGYAFSSAAALEGQTKLTGLDLTDLSPQQMIDCSVQMGNQGCIRGRPTPALFSVFVNGVTQEQIYPYTGKIGTCIMKPPYLRIQNVQQTMGGTEQQLKLLTGSFGPTAAEMCVSQDFLVYSHGIFETTQCTRGVFNHAVTVVGYGTEGADEFWLVKNSWGTKWGEHGYAKIARNKDNMCNLATRFAVPIGMQ